jgi:ribosomal protein S18 acetylase RimI-like enzyme
MDEATDLMIVRSYHETDAGALEQLWAEAFPDDPPANAPALMIHSKLRVQPELLLVCSINKRLIGAIIAGFDGVRGWLYHLAVTADWQRQGVGTQLVRAAEVRLAELGCKKVNLQVRSTNSAVVAFYARLGYQVEERVSMGRRLS